MVSVGGKKIEDLRVADLKSELKRLGLPQNGLKKDLVDRLRSHMEEADKGSTAEAVEGEDKGADVAPGGESGPSTEETEALVDTDAAEKKQESAPPESVPSVNSSVLSVSAGKADGEQVTETPSVSVAGDTSQASPSGTHKSRKEEVAEEATVTTAATAMETEEMPSKPASAVKGKRNKTDRLKAKGAAPAEEKVPQKDEGQKEEAKGMEVGDGVDEKEMDVDGAKGVHEDVQIAPAKEAEKVETEEGKQEEEEEGDEHRELMIEADHDLVGQLEAEAEEAEAEAAERMTADKGKGQGRDQGGRKRGAEAVVSTGEKGALEQTAKDSPAAPSSATQTKRIRRWGSNSNAAAGIAATSDSPDASGKAKKETSDQAQKEGQEEVAVKDQPLPVAGTPSSAAAPSPRAAAPRVLGIPEPSPNHSRGSASMPNGAASTKLEVPPSSEPPTTSLRIDNFVRPFTQKAVQELLARSGTVKTFWMNTIRTHCYVTYESVEQASGAREALYGLLWPPQGGKNLTAKFVDEEEVKRVAEGEKAGEGGNEQGKDGKGTPAFGNERPAAAAAGAAVRRVVVAKEKGVGKEEAGQKGLLGAMPDAKVGVASVGGGVSGSGGKSSTEKGAANGSEEGDLPTLDDLFRKTAAKPHLYYLPLTEAEVKAKAAKATEAKSQP